MIDPAKIYQVGGAVRDQIMGRPAHDRDFVVVGVSSEEMRAAGFTRVGVDFPVFLAANGEEYALARTERKTGPGYHGFETVSSPQVTLLEDLQRRDLTINAMAIDHQGQFIDPFGGQADIQSKTLRHVSEAFAEDPLRVLRIARFAAQMGFSIAPETERLCQRLTQSGELAHLTPERIGKELKKVLLARQPSAFFNALQTFGALKVLFPEVHALIGQSQPKEHHGEGDAFIHSMMVLDLAGSHDGKSYFEAVPESALKLRFAALCHDLGKGLTAKHLLPQHHGHEEAGVEPAKQLALRVHMGNECSHAGQIAARYHTHVHYAKQLTAQSYVKLFNSLDKETARNDALLISQVGLADHHGRISATAHLPYGQAAFFRGVIDAIAEVKLRHLVAPESIAAMSIEKRKNILHQGRIHAAKQAILQQTNSLLEAQIGGKPPIGTLGKDQSPAPGKRHGGAER